MNHQARLDHLATRLDIIRANWSRAIDAAVEQQSDGLASPSFEPGGRSSTVSSVTERTALANIGSGRQSSLIDKLEDQLVALERATATLTNEVLRAAPPKARNAPDGRVVIDCANPYGCPTAGQAKREGLCPSCWSFADTNLGRHRRTADVDEATERQRAATRERVANHRSRQDASQSV